MALWTKAEQSQSKLSLNEQDNSPETNRNHEDLVHQPSSAEWFVTVFQSFEAGIQQFPTSNDEKYLYFQQINIFKVELLD